MKASKPKMTAVVAAAMMSLSHVAKADEQSKITLLEQLSPQDRAAVEERIRILDQQIKIDWNSVIVGLNEKGEIVLIPRHGCGEARIAEPSCWVRE